MLITSMADYSLAVELIRKYEGYSEKAYPDPATGEEPYTLGFGTQFYPDGSPVRQGQRCTYEKAIEYLFNEITVIEAQLRKLNLGLDPYMTQALVSFIHSVGWESFLYSEVIDNIEREDFHGATLVMSDWVFDAEHKVIGGLIDRRREESELFLTEIDPEEDYGTDILLRAFRYYSASRHQVAAIRQLETQISPYVLAEFANSFRVQEDPWAALTDSELNAIFDV